MEFNQTGAEDTDSQSSKTLWATLKIDEIKDKQIFSNIQIDNANIIHLMEADLPVDIQISAKAKGYHRVYKNLKVSETGIHKILLTTQLIDPNGDRQVDLSDAILMLRVIAGFDINSNSKNFKIGLEELIFTIREISGIK